MDAEDRDKTRGVPEPRVFEAVDESVALLRRMGPDAWGPYIAGTLGFLWALLHFISHMSRHPLAASRLAGLSFLLALAFTTMKACHAHFFTRLMATLAGGEPAPLRAGRALHLLASQALIQPWSLLALPIAMALALPFPWALAFFQNAQWVRPGEPVREGLARALRLSLVWPGQNLSMQLFFFAAGACILLNIIAALAILPQLLKSLFGLDSAFTMGSHAYLNTTFLALVAALAWAAFDPLIKAVYAWRCYRGGAVRTGDDLRLALERARKPIRPAAGTPARAGALAALLSLAPTAAADGPERRMDRAPAPMESPASPAAPILEPDRLDALLEREIADPIYGWRMPRRAARNAGSDNFFLFRWIEKAVDAVIDAARWTSGRVKRFLEWFDSLFGREKRGTENGGLPGLGALPSQLLVAGLLVALTVGLALALLGRRKAGPAPDAPPAPAAAPVPDLEREDVRADALPEEEWMRLMEQLRERGEHRLALRALFLATLSLSSRKGWLTLARHKSNRDYVREVALRARRDPAVAESFRETCRRFDRTWYGLHVVSEEDWKVSLANFARLDGDAG